MTEYFSPVSRHLARLRCLEETLNCIFEKRPVPESICYVPSFEYYEIHPELAIMKTEDENGLGTYLDLREKPGFNSEPAFDAVDGQKIIYDGRTLFLCSRRIQVNEKGEGVEFYFTGDSIWLEIVGIWHKNADKAKRFQKPVYLFVETRPASATETQSTWTKYDSLRPLRSKTTTNGNRGLGEAGGCKHVFDRWEEVVEIVYGITIASRILNDSVTPPDSERVSAMRRPPSSDWDHRHDEALVKFLVETGQAADDKGGRAGAVWAHVEKIELSSSVEHMDDAVAALTDDNPSTYWESDGSQSPHYIRLHMKKNTFIEKLYLTIDTADDSYLPQKICVLASEKKHRASSEMRKINTTGDYEADHSGDICIYEATEENARPYAIVEIQILECKDEGIDTRIRGLKIKTKQDEEPNGDLELQINEERLKEHPILFCSAIDQQAIKWRAMLLKRTAALMDSVLHYLLPQSELSLGVDEDEDDSYQPFSAILRNMRFLLPLSHKRQLLFDRYLKETESRVALLTFRSAYDLCPKLFINRQLARDNRTQVDATVFRQVYEGLKLVAHQQDIVLNYRWSLKHEQWWECKFIGEGVIDQGGGFRDSLCDIAEELCPPDADSQIPLPYFVRSPNQHEDEHNRDTFVVNPACDDFGGYEWIGKVLGACLRTKEHLILTLTKFTWKSILGQSVTWAEDFITVDRSLIRLVEKMQNMSNEGFDQYFGANATTMTAILCNGDVIDLVPNGSNTPLSYENRLEYIERLKECRLDEGSKQIKAIRRGLLRVVPEVALRLMTWFELERRISGNPDVSTQALKKAARFEELEGNEKRVQYLWEALESFSNEERSKFLRFVTGRRRLPTPLYICTDKSDSALGVNDQNVLPESSTCSNTLFLPDYASAKICAEKLRYAINNCLAIDTDMSPWED